MTKTFLRKDWILLWQPQTFLLLSRNNNPQYRYPRNWEVLEHKLAKPRRYNPKSTNLRLKPEHFLCKYCQLTKETAPTSWTKLIIKELTMYFKKESTSRIKGRIYNMLKKYEQYSFIKPKRKSTPHHNKILQKSTGLGRSSEVNNSRRISPAFD